MGETFEIADGRGQPLRLRVVALLADSIFQGDLLISEGELLKHFPNTSGYRFFLVDCPAEQTAAVQNALERNLGDYGFAAETTAARLADLLAVQNTYLSTFQSLGGLGLLLGTLGLAAVQLRSVFERRGELALCGRPVSAAAGWPDSCCWSTPCCWWPAWASACWRPCWPCCRNSWSARTSLPWASLAGTLLAVLSLGLAAGGLAVRAVLRAPLLLSLRQENL